MVFHLAEGDSALLNIATEATSRPAELSTHPPNIYEDPVIEQHLGFSSVTVRTKDPDCDIDLDVAFMNWVHEYGTDRRSRQQQQQQAQHLQQHSTIALEAAGRQ